MLLKEAGYTSAVVAKQQMEEVGFKVDLQVLDWATVVQRRSKPELWDIFTTGITFSPDPALTSNLQCNWPGWWCHEEKERLLAELIRESDAKKRRALIERELKGFSAGPFLHFWDTWLAK